MEIIKHVYRHWNDFIVLYSGKAASRGVFLLYQIEAGPSSISRDEKYLLMILSVIDILFKLVAASK